KALNMVEPEHRPRATEYIEQMKEMVNDLLNKEMAYVTKDGIYFDVKKFKSYGKLSGNTIENLCAGARVDVNDQKKCSADFALWKFCTGTNENHVLRWSSPGESNKEGFPGWHIECSAMSRSLLGDQIDIHTGGEDNIFPHHECEIAQSESVTGKDPFVSMWVHRRRIDMGAEKMSKSLGNVLNLDDICGMGYSPLDLRYLFLSVHYRTQLKFTEKGLSDAKKARRKIMEWMSIIDNAFPDDSSISHEMDEQIKMFKNAMDEDLNTPAALADIFTVMNFYYANPKIDQENLIQYKEFVKIVRNTFGCFKPEAEGKVPEEVEKLLRQREDARANKDFALSDSLRDEIKALGYEVRDSGEDQILKHL
ncbi:MAG: hypothetical protein KAS32_27140, partial [Candidatus Peribacteraceae bacterium]|nr:hypothetical protein [Candidatus Peribacteraceae bacterium]